MGLAPAIRSARRAAPAALAAATIGVILAIAGCSSSGAGQDGSAGGASGGSNAAAGAKGGRYDPMNGKYPVVQWMVNVWEADKPLGSQTGPSQTVVAEPQVVPTLDAARALPGSTLSSAPCVLANPGQDAGVKVRDRDKANQEVRTVDLSFNATLDGEAVVAKVTNNGREWPAVRVMKGGAIVVCQPSSVSPGRWSVVMLRPSVLRSVEDYPFQTSTALEGGA